MRRSPETFARLRLALFILTGTIMVSAAIVFGVQLKEFWPDPLPSRPEGSLGSVVGICWLHDGRATGRFRLPLMASDVTEDFVLRRNLRDDLKSANDLPPEWYTYRIHKPAHGSVTRAFLYKVVGSNGALIGSGAVRDPFGQPLEPNGYPFDRRLLIQKLRVSP